MSKFWKIASFLALVAGFPSVSGADEKFVPASLIEPTSTYVHGTVDVVIYTKQGFILASDSRASKSDGTHSDDAQKIFPVGKQAACVIAGLVGTDYSKDGFRLQDTIGGHLQMLGQGSRNQARTASEIAWVFSFALQSVAGLRNPSATKDGDPLGAISAVSISSDGKAEWVTLILPAIVQIKDGVSYVTSAEPRFYYRPVAPNLDFDYRAVGAGAPYVEALMRADSTLSPIPSSWSPPLRKYYERKQNGRLGDYTVAEAAELAQVLIQTSIQYSPEAAGVGGPVDIYAVTSHGAGWIARKTEFAPLPPSYFARSFEGSYEGGVWLDGMECFRCKFKNVNMKYFGSADVQLVESRFENSCKLTIEPGAKQKRPEVVARLKAALGPHCEIVEQ
jgi:hypothetical protein